MSDWIAVEERLPESGSRVDVWAIFSVTNYGVRITDVYRTDNRWHNMLIDYTVTHWMPLPAPPAPTAAASPAPPGSRDSV